MPAPQDPASRDPGTAVRTPARLLRATALVALLFLGGTIGYRAVEGAGWWEAFFMTVITITTVGFREVFPLSMAGQLLTVVLLLSGLGIFFFLASEIGRAVMEGELRHYLGRVRRSRMMERMTGHDIVCGYGRMGRAVVDELQRAGRNVVVVDSRGDRVRGLEARGVATVTGDATLESTLREASVRQARGLVSCVNDDAHNVYTVLTARAMNPGLLIVGRATEDGAERRIRQAGADRVVNPYHLGGTRLAHLVVKPAIVSFFDATTAEASQQLDQTALGQQAPVVGQSVAQANIRERWGLTVVAVQRGNDVVASPPEDYLLEAGDILVVFGERPLIDVFDRDCG